MYISKMWQNIILISIVVISTLMHLPHFSKDLVSIHVWRQTQTQSTINSFYEEDMNILNPRRNDRGNTEGYFRMEFPLMQWLVALQYKIFGNHLIITRIFMFIIGLFSIFGIYKLLYYLFNNSTLSVIGAWAFNFSPTFYYYTINPLPDNMALCFSIWGLVLFFKWLNSTKKVDLLLSGLLLSLGALCKLPFIVYYIVPIVYFARIIIKNGISKSLVLDKIAAFIFSVLPLVWYISVIPSWSDNPIIGGMFDNKESIFKLLDYFKHNLISTLPELLLNYGSLLFFIAGFVFLKKREAYKDSKFILILSLSILVLIYYLFEANAIEKSHDYYLFPFYPLLFMLVAYGAFHFYSQTNKFRKYLTIFLLCILPLTCFLRMQIRWGLDSPGFNKDLLVYKTELKNAVPKESLVVCGNDISHFIFFYYIDKKGWGFDNDNLSSESLKEMINKGAEYMYTDSEKVINNEDLRIHFDKLLLEKGSIKVFSLK